MKKLIISSYDDIKNPVYGGGGASAIKSIAELLHKDYEVTVLTGAYDGSQNETIKHVKYIRVGTSFFGHKIGQLIFQVCLIPYVLRSNYDLWIESFTPPFSTAFLPFFTAKPVVGLVHMLAGADMQRKYKLPFKHIENLGLKIYKYFIVLSADTKNSIKTQNPRAEMLVVPNGVEYRKIDIAKSFDSRKYILFMGRLEVNQKGLDMLLQSYMLLLQHTDIELVIAGAGDTREMNKLEVEINKYNLSSRVHLVGKVSGKVKDNLYRHAKFVVIPSRFETFSLTALEALSYGLPVVCFDIPGMKWLDKKIALKISQGDLDGYANAMQKLIDDRAFAKSRSREGYKFVKQFSWESIATKYIKYFDKILC